ncbi:recombinase family protein [Arthrobacter bambusae]|uniref:recombinase family protein n=1 Tax=Arthrobacter bambusae TaxID=1338426 RepID=UPI00351FFA56
MKQVGRPRTLDLAQVQRIVTMRQEGMPIAAIANHLTREGIPTARGGKAWSPGTIQTVLKSKTARGEHIEENSLERRSVNGERSS